MIPRTLFGEEHEAFRDAYRRFLANEVEPHHAAWEAQGFVDREVWRKAGAHGFLCSSMPERYGGAGADRLFQVVLMEENARINATGLGFGLHSEIVAPYLVNHGSEAQKQRWLPPMARGEVIGAIAMTEPGAGSDLQAIRTGATDRGDHYVLNGSKTFITNGWHSDLVIVVAKTRPDAGARGTSLLLVERGMAGFEKGRPLAKVGLKAQDTCELFFADVKVPKANLLGPENGGFALLMQELPWERLQIAVTAVASARAAIDATLAHVRQRELFGRCLGSFQHTRFRLAELHTETEVAQVFVDRCLGLLGTGALSPASAAMAKAWCTELQGRVLDQCVQLHGGAGYMDEYRISHMFTDARVSRIYAGSSEIMKEIIARGQGLDERKI
jgi:alkylation response protein AidB-like acyl-CoA dehydrogenase